jgi:hypothetical protein
VTIGEMPALPGGAAAATTMGAALAPLAVGKVMRPVADAVITPDTSVTRASHGPAGKLGSSTIDTGPLSPGANVVTVLTGNGPADSEDGPFVSSR